MEECKLDIHRDNAPALDQAPARTGELTNDRRLNLAALHEVHERIAFLRRDSKRHTLLGLRDPDLPGRHTGVLERDLVEVHPAAVALFCHLGNRAGEPPGPVVGDAPVQPEVPGLLDQNIGKFLLRDRVANLDCRHRARGVKCLGGERCPVDAVFPHPAANHHHKIARLGFLLGEPDAVCLSWHHADRTGKDERFPRVPVVKVTETLRCGDARTVPAHADATDDTVKDLPR